MAMRWYVVHAYSGLREEGQQLALKERIRTGTVCRIVFGEVLVPTEEVVEMRSVARSAAVSASSSPATCWCRWNWTMTPGTW